MTEEGPSITYLTHRISEIPEPFLAEPAMTGKGKAESTVSTAALLSDTLAWLGFGFLSADEAGRLALPADAKNRNYLLAVHCLCYLLRDPWFAEFSEKKGTSFRDGIMTLITRDLRRHTDAAQAGRYVTEPEGREEIGRILLNGLGLLPRGESDVVARDRFFSISSVERAKVVEKSKQAQKRVQEIREAMARKAAEEAASKMSRE